LAGGDEVDNGVPRRAAGLLQRTRSAPSTEERPRFERPAEAEAYTDLFADTDDAESYVDESDDTASSVSTVVDRLHSRSSTANSSFSEHGNGYERPSVPRFGGVELERAMHPLEDIQRDRDTQQQQTQPSRELQGRTTSKAPEVPPRPSVQHKLPLDDIEVSETPEPQPVAELIDLEMDETGDRDQETAFLNGVATPPMAECRNNQISSEETDEPLVEDAAVEYQKCQIIAAKCQSPVGGDRHTMSYNDQKHGNAAKHVQRHMIRERDYLTGEDNCSQLSRDQRQNQYQSIAPDPCLRHRFCPKRCLNVEETVKKFEGDSSKGEHSKEQKQAATVAIANPRLTRRLALSSQQPIPRFSASQSGVKRWPSVGAGAAKKGSALLDKPDLEPCPLPERVEHLFTSDDLDDIAAIEGFERRSPSGDSFNSSSSQSSAESVLDAGSPCSPSGSPTLGRLQNDAQAPVGPRNDASKVHFDAAAAVYGDKAVHRDAKDNTQGSAAAKERQPQQPRTSTPVRHCLEPEPGE
ncbi:hypothetical protein BIW11_10106, partial [Tropilaelaps mercedesae]